jgi:hypothetical protein
MILDLENLDATLLMLDPDYKLKSIKPKASGRPRIGPTGARLPRYACPFPFSGRP